MSTALMSVWPAGCLKQLVSLSYLDGWKTGAAVNVALSQGNKNTYRHL